MPYARTKPLPSNPLDPKPIMYLDGARFGADVNGNIPEQTPIGSIADFDRLVVERNVGYVMFGFYGYPRRAVDDMAKARKLVVKLLKTL